MVRGAGQRQRMGIAYCMHVHAHTGISYYNLHYHVGYIPDLTASLKD